MPSDKPYSHFPAAAVLKDTAHVFRQGLPSTAAQKRGKRDLAAVDVVSGEQAPPRLHAGRGGRPPPRDLPNQELPIRARADAQPKPLAHPEGA